MLHGLSFTGNADLANAVHVTWAPLDHQVLAADHGRVRAQNGRAFDDVLELSHVPRPPVQAECGKRVGGQHLRFLIGTSVVGQKVECDRFDIIDAVPQRREHEREDVQPVVQILPEFTAGDHLLEERARRRDDATFDRDLGHAAEPPDTPRLERAEQLGLEGTRQMVHFVQQQGTGPRQLEQPLFSGVGAGERDSGMAAQLIATNGSLAVAPA